MIHRLWAAIFVMAVVLCLESGALVWEWQADAASRTHLETGLDRCAAGLANIQHQLDQKLHP